jgi:hypothetical protein
MKIPARLFLAIAVLVPFTARAAEENLPPPEATEYWEPVPAVVSAPAGGVPSDAIVLFDGTKLDAWEPSQARDRMWRIEDGAMLVVPEKFSPEEAAKLKRDRPEGNWSGIWTKQGFGDVQLHVEFRTPAVVKGKSQARGNSGIFLMDRYEVQVLDSYENPTYVNGQLGSIYKQYPPLVNPARPPGEWQTYDIIFIAPRFNADGSVASPARMTVLLNGVLVQYDAVLRGPTVWRGQPKYSPHPAKVPISLQNHGDLVAYRNIWVREITLPAAK